jgi:lipid-A-disaccharide synthase-like uncharacterized protein
MNAFWFGLGILGQAVFASRFLLQWLVSEHAHRSIIPKQFWMLSMSGSVLLLAYSIHRRDPVFILGQAAGSFIYIRNLMLLDREKRLAEGGN